MCYAKLKGRIKELYNTQTAFSVDIGISQHLLSRKLNGKASWKREEIELACKLLHIPIENVHAYFFNQKVGI